MKFIATAVFALVAGIVVTGLVGDTASAAQNNTSQATQTQQTEVDYKYVAGQGDAYSQLARKAIQTYGKKYNVELTLGQVIFAETNLTLQAGSPLLEIGQEVIIKEATVKSWVEKAKALSDADKAAWEAYVPYVDFNTDTIGRG